MQSPGVFRFLIRCFCLSDTHHRFSARGWVYPQQVSQEKLDENKQIAATKLSALASGLPSKFHPLINSLQANLDQLYSASYHQTLSHGHFSALNIIVSPQTGSIRIVDWEDAGIRPFGMDSVGLEELVGYMGPEGWKYHDRRTELESEFWKVFWDVVDTEQTGLQAKLHDRIKMARDLGILFQYGFRGDTTDVVAEGDPNPNPLKYLSALLLS